MRDRHDEGQGLASDAPVRRRVGGSPSTDPGSGHAGARPAVDEARAVNGDSPSEAAPPPRPAPEERAAAAEARAGESPRDAPAPGGRPRPERHPTLNESVEELMANVRRLARYAVETANLPPTLDVGELYRIQHGFEMDEPVDDRDFRLLVSAYQELEKRLGPVSAETLKATEIVDPRQVGAASVGWRPWRLLRPTPPLSAGDRYVRFLELRTYVNIGMVLLMHLIHWWSGVDSVNGVPAGTVWYMAVLGLAAVYSIPFLYGALGADAYVLRETTHTLHTREFDPRRIPENRSRFLLGALSGGMIILFFSQEVVSGGMAGPFELGYAALGFIAGYSTDFLFNTIERLLGAILPRHRDDPRRRVRAEDRSHRHGLEVYGHASLAAGTGTAGRERSEPGDETVGGPA